jgi:hypothetical protein
MLHQATLFQARHDLLQFVTGGQEVLFKMLISGKRGLFVDAKACRLKEPHHHRLMFMLWIYCYAVCRTWFQPRQIFYISNSVAETNAARNLFHGIGMVCIQDPEDAKYDFKKADKKPTFKFQVGDLVVRFMSADSSAVYKECTAGSADAIVFCDTCMPHWAVRFSKQRGKYVYGVT